MTGSDTRAEPFSALANQTKRKLAAKAADSRHPHLDGRSRPVNRQERRWRSTEYEYIHIHAFETGNRARTLGIADARSVQLCLHQRLERWPTSASTDVYKSTTMVRLQLKLFLGFYFKILQSWKYPDLRFLFPKGRHIDHNAILCSRVAYLELDPLPASVRSDYPVL